MTCLHHAVHRHDVTMLVSLIRRRDLDSTIESPVTKGLPKDMESLLAEIDKIRDEGEDD